MFGQAVVLVLAGSIYPAGLLMIAIYLGTAHPTKLAGLFLAGAATATAVSGAIFLVVLRSANLDHPDNSGTLGGIRLALGLVFALLGLYLLRHRPAVSRVEMVEAMATGEQQTVAPGAKPGMLARFQRSDRPWIAFVAGVFIYLPGPGYLAGLQVLGSAQVSVAETVAVFVVLVVLDLWLVWVPLATYRIAPERTGRVVRDFNAWLSRNGRTLTGAVLIALGAFLVATGISALVS